MSDQEPDEDFTPWTAEGAARLRTAAGDLAAAVVAHAESVTAVTSRVGIDEVFAASGRLLPAVLAYADAQFDYTGNGFPFGVLHDYAEGDDELDDEADEDEPEPSVGISVLQRHDYRVIDEAAVMSAGRAAYLRVWPEDDEDAAAADVTYLGRALYQIAHADSGRASTMSRGFSQRADVSESSAETTPSGLIRRSGPKKNCSTMKTPSTSMNNATCTPDNPSGQA